MAKVYVLTVDTGESLEVRAFENKERPQEIMRHRYEAERDDYISIYGEDNVSHYIDEDCASVQLEGSHMEEHIDFLITECEIE